MIRKSAITYGLLAAAWCLVMAWQTVEHLRVRSSAREALISRARDITRTTGLVIRSQRRWGGIVSKERLESALNELVRHGELTGISLLNATGDVVASAGTAAAGPPRVPRTGIEWERESVNIMNLIDLGAAEGEGGEERPAIVLPRPDIPAPPGGTNRPGRGPGRWRPPPENPRETPTNANVPSAGPGPRAPADGAGDRSRFGRPFWMSEEEYRSISQKRGVHGFMILMSTASVRSVIAHDLQLRALIAALASVLAVGSSLAWRNMAKASDLQLRLVRAGELNARLREMNLAAAGLAHETRNPLNIIRGLAQLISKQPDASIDEIRRKSRDIINETDRVTGQLNEFINYTRPREVRRQNVALNATVGEVTRALGYDLEEKAIRLEVFNEPWTVQADEQLLRQALFNLLLNAIQAVRSDGEIRITAARAGAGELTLEIQDNGPGVPAEKRTEIFTPYYTTNENGTGLGLAVVQQIVLAHGWEIECLPNTPKGAVFRISHLRIVEP